MDLYRVGMPEEDIIIVRDKFIVDNISPLCIQKISDDQYSMLFSIYQDSTETTLFLQTLFKYDEKDEGFLHDHNLNISSIRRDKERLDEYNEKIENMHGNLFNTDFDMRRSEDNARYFIGVGVKALNLPNGNVRASMLDLYITRDNFIKINMFINKFLKLDYSAENVFKNKKLNNLEFVTIEHIKLNGSCENNINNMVYSSYTVGVGPTCYNLNFISPIVEDRKLINIIIADTFDSLYMDEYFIDYIIKDAHEDIIYVPYEVRNKITNTYIKTVILVMHKEIYNRSNFIELDKVYEKKNSNDIITI